MSKHGLYVVSYFKPKPTMLRNKIQRKAHFRSYRKSLDKLILLGLK